MSCEQRLAKIRELCLGMPGAFEDHPWEEIVFKVGGKIFAMTGESASRVSLASTLERQSQLVLHPCIEVAPYVGRFGWVTIDVEDAEGMSIAEDLICDSYQLIISKLPKSKRPVQ
ncbi:MAG: hypothetical protein HONBIEJF_02293 [Fimbriimonadaceae bacterium]|nr:hypothetical protein [Fimbriimonadaceae bacterium]